MDSGGNSMRASGRLTMATVADLFRKGVPLKEGVTDFVVDMAQVDAVDSAAVSLMLVWLRAAQRSKVKLTFINVPENLLSLANLYGVAESLSLRVDSANA
ncbi:MAG: anti-sigma-factor [Gallionellaceae bacterium]|nr:MAG: anti-sigma-factor [Gallionellaceae bacterium]